MDTVKEHKLVNMIKSGGARKKNPALKIGVHGREKVGKTTFAATFPNPLLGDLENGARFLSQEIDVVPWWDQPFSQVMSDLDRICADDHTYQTFILDSADWLEAKIEEDVCKSNGVTTINEIQWGKGRGYAQARWMKLLEKLDYLVSIREMSVVLICHSAIKRIEDPIYPTYDSWSFKLNDKSTALTSEWLDVIGYLHFKTDVQETQEGWKKQVRALGSDQRILSLTHKPAYLAGNRLGLPEEIDASYEEFVASIDSSIK